jgi:hypothetical protein
MYGNIWKSRGYLCARVITPSSLGIQAGVGAYHSASQSVWTTAASTPTGLGVASDS